MSFVERLRAAGRKSGSLLCVGLDPDERLLPEAAGKGTEGMLRFNRAIVDQTADLACAFKLNLAFYLAAGPAGLEVLAETVRHIAGRVPVILDLKCGDIQNTAGQYARACYETLGCDAATVNPLLGEDAVAPFLAYPEGCAFILCLTSNPSAADFERRLQVDGHPLYRHIAARIGAWSLQGGCGAVVAPLDRESMQLLRVLLPHVPFLIPGIGAQGLDLELAVRHGTDGNGELALINVSRAIIYASAGTDFDKAARLAAQHFNEEINKFR